MPSRVAACLALLLAVPLLAGPVEGQARDPREDPTDPRDFTWVRQPVLAVGGGGLTEEDVALVRELGFQAVANFRAEHDDPADALAAHELDYLYLPVEYALDINVSMLRSFVDWSKDQEAAGHAVYAHCIGGWHRTAAFATAWLMEREGLGYDEAGQYLIKNRPGTAMRVPSTLLAWQAELGGKPGLVVLMNAAKAHPLPGGELPITVDVYGGGRPLPGASVNVTAEGKGVLAQGVTDTQGRFTFTFRAPEDAHLTYLFARATSPGFMDGADNVEMYHFLPVPQNYPIVIEPIVLDEGIGVTILDDGEPVSARLYASTPAGWSAFDTTSTGVATLPRPDEGGDVTLIASRFGEAPVSVVVPVEPRARPPPPQAAPPTDAPAPDPGPAPARDVAFAPIALGVVLATIALVVTLTARRTRAPGR